MTKFEKILCFDNYSYITYKNLSEDQKKEFEENYKKTWKFKYHQLNYLMRKYINKWGD